MLSVRTGCALPSCRPPCATPRLCLASGRRESSPAQAPSARPRADASEEKLQHSATLPRLSLPHPRQRSLDRLARPVPSAISRRRIAFNTTAGRQRFNTPCPPASAPQSSRQTSSRPFSSARLRLGSRFSKATPARPAAMRDSAPDRHLNHASGSLPNIRQLPHLLGSSIPPSRTSQSEMPA